MLREHFPPDDPRAWLIRARSNLRHARAEEDEVCYEDLCFDAQQAVEKALKGLLLHRGVQFPYTHDLAALVDLLERSGTVVPSPVRASARLTVHAVQGRYPGLGDPVAREDYLAAVAAAEEVVKWVERSIRRNAAK